MWTIGIMSALFVSFCAWSASTILDVRDRTAVINEKVRRIEETDIERKKVPVDIAEIKVELTALRNEFSLLRSDIRKVNERR